jgi:putative transposase
MKKAFKYKLQPTKAQEDSLTWTLDRCRELYNAALEERKTAYKKCGVSLGFYDQSASLPYVKEARPEYNDVYSQVLQDVLRRLDKAFKGFFNRIKRGEKAGYPRFRGKNRYDSFTYPQYKDSVNDGARHIRLPKIGDVRIRLSRPLEGKVKTCMVQRERCGDWFAIFVCEVEPEPLSKADSKVGIDFGLTHIVTTSDGEKEDAPKHLRKAEKALKKAQRRLARRKKGSKRREKARILAAKLHRKIQRQRAHFLHYHSSKLIREHDLIAIEDLNLRGLNKGMLAKSFNDVAIGHLTAMLTYKAEWAGRQLVKVDPRYTSQDCSNCGHRSGKKPLHIRKWTCQACNVEHDRDVNAAKNILARAEPLVANGSGLLHAVG